MSQIRISESPISPISNADYGSLVFLANETYLWDTHKKSTRGVIESIESNLRLGRLHHGNEVLQVQQHELQGLASNPMGSFSKHLKFEALAKVFLKGIPDYR